MLPSNAATVHLLEKLAGDALLQLKGIPEQDLNTWKPALPMTDINTFFVLATHLVGAGEYWILQAAGGQMINRNRHAEFTAEGTLANLNRRYQDWLSASARVLAELTEEKMAQTFVRTQNDSTGLSGGHWTVAECVAHALEHTAVHVGHLQLQRQIWDAEQSQKDQ